MTREQNLYQAKEQIRKTGSRKFVLTDRGSREFFKYQDGRLEEYDCMSYYGEKVLLNKEELSVINNDNN